MISFVSGIVASATEKFQSAKEWLLKPSTPANGIFDKDGVENLFPGIGIMGVTVNQEKTVASHPLEINKFQQDNIVNNPASITVVLSAGAADADRLYRILGQLYSNNDVLVSILCDNRLYKNFVIGAMPIQRTPDAFNLLEVPVVFHEFVYRRARVSLMSDPANVELSQYSDRQKAGLQRPQLVSGQDKINIESQKTVVPGGGR